MATNYPTPETAPASIAAVRAAIAAAEIAWGHPNGQQYGTAEHLIPEPASAATVTLCGLRLDGERHNDSLVVGVYSAWRYTAVPSGRWSCKRCLRAATKRGVTVPLLPDVPMREFAEWPAALRAEWESVRMTFYSRNA